MARITILAVGKIKHVAFKHLQEEYFQRLSHYVSCCLVEVKDSPQKESTKKIKEESELILKRLTKDDFVILLDETGKALTSKNLAKQVETINHQGIRHLVFVIGGPYGVSEVLKKRANQRLSLSTLTLPHELARVFLLEQLYRAHTILRGEKYHH